ncbi:hypothetical protein [Streptomyces sp. 5-6(2022)]|uniref:hypothetical protein n=1 Tax=Streptomyces sp. 5-6(2022) TaxID=2936510 RepID=UPI0023B99328|nr:hypothetical protein [Streptomyces sp. 5-6(2022)]
MGLDLGGPLGDEFGVRSCFQGFAVAGELGVAFGDHPFGVLCTWSGCDVGLSGLHESDGLFQSVGSEGQGEPVVERGQEIPFGEVDIARVGDLVGQGVFVGEPAAVVQAVLALLALHAPPADPAVQQPAEDVRVVGALALAGVLARTLAREHLLDLLEGLDGDQWLVDGRGGPYPGIGPVPAHPGLMAQGHVVDVEEDFVLALLVPHLVSGVAGVGQDRADCALGPGDAGAVAIAGVVVRGRAGDALVGQDFSDGEQPVFGDLVEMEDPLHDRRGDRVGLQAVQAAPVGGLGRVGVRSGVDEPVAVGRASPEVAAFDLGLGAHRGANADLDAVAFALAHAAEDRHHQVVRLGLRIDGPADFRHPQLHAVVDEDGEGQAELVAVEGTLRLADHDRFEAPVGVFERLQQGRGARPALPGDRP